jgi:hypothetical protein
MRRAASNRCLKQPLYLKQPLSLKTQLLADREVAGCGARLPNIVHATHLPCREAKRGKESTKILRGGVTGAGCQGADQQHGAG